MLCLRAAHPILPDEQVLFEPFHGLKSNAAEADIVKVPSDLIVDVMRAANPARLQSVKVRLGELAAAGTASQPNFAAALQSNSRTPMPADRDANDILVGVMNAAEPGKLAAAKAKLASLSQPAGSLAESRNSKDPYGQFESFLLRTAFEEILPAANANNYGDGFAGSVWRSMAAEQFANLFADRGGIGIADMMRHRLASDQAKDLPVQSAQWPYFSQASISPLA